MTPVSSSKQSVSALSRINVSAPLAHSTLLCLCFSTNDDVHRTGPDLLCHDNDLFPKVRFKTRESEELAVG